MFDRTNETLRATRRDALLGLGALSLARPVPSRAFAQQAESSATPSSTAKVFLDYTQAELDDAYNQRVWAPNAKEIIERYASDSPAVRAATPPETFSYGDGAKEKLDVFRPADASGAPIHLHLHGGAWRALTRDDASFLAPDVTASGAVYVALDFDTIPDVRLPQMMAQARQAVGWLHANAERIVGDANRIHVSGHSSGAHMAGVLLTTDWAAQGLPADVLKSGLLISGMYDLAPVMLSSRSGYVEVSADDVDALSAMRHLDRLTAPVVITYGSEESPEFQRHSRDFAAAVANAGKAEFLFPMAGVNHFEMPYAALAQGALPRRASEMLMAS